MGANIKKIDAITILEQLLLEIKQFYKEKA